MVKPRMGRPTGTIGAAAGTGVGGLPITTQGVPAGYVRTPPPEPTPAPKVPKPKPRYAPADPRSPGGYRLTPKERTREELALGQAVVERLREGKRIRGGFMRDTGLVNTRTGEPVKVKVKATPRVGHWKDMGGGRWLWVEGR